MAEVIPIQSTELDGKLGGLDLSAKGGISDGKNHCVWVQGLQHRY
jgi:hypothetical protein